MVISTHLLQIIIVFSLFVNAAILLPQVYEIIRHREASHVSLTTFVGLCIVQTLVVFVATVTKNYLVLGGGLLCLLACALVVVYAYHYRAKMTEVHDQKQRSVSRPAMEKMIASMPGYVYWMNKKGLFLGCNNNFANLFGLAHPDEVVGKTSRGLAGPQGVEKLFAINNQDVIERAVSMRNEGMLFHPSGESQTFLSIKDPLFSEQGEVIGLLGLLVDITAAKTELRMLRDAKDEAEQANRAKSNFIAHMSHDFRTPMTGIIGISEELSSQDLSREQVTEYASDLVKAGNRLLDLMNEIIQLAHADKISSKLHTELFSVQDLLNSIYDLMWPSCESKGLSFKVINSVDLSHDQLLAERLLIHRIILNLLSNAIKFTDKGGVKLEIKTRTVAEDLIELVFCVSDTGCGIPPEKQSSIFTAFTKLSQSYRGLYRGSGLGLFIAKQYVDSMKGSIDVKSQEGKGSQFTVTLPIKWPVYREDVEKKPPLSDDQFMPSPDRGEPAGRVLLVEDDPLTCKVTIIKLSRVHERVDYATSGEEALEKLKKNAYDLVYMDLGLPGISGDELARRYRHWECSNRRGTLPILALTAHSDELISHNCLAAGMDEVLEKPLTEQCIDRVRATYVDRELVL